MTTSPEVSIMRDGPARALAQALTNLIEDAAAECTVPGAALTLGQSGAIRDALTAIFERELSAVQSAELAAHLAGGTLVYDSEQ